MTQVHPQGSVPQSRGPLSQAVQEPRDGGVLPAGVQAQGPVRLGQQPALLRAGPLRVPRGLLVLVDGAEGGVGLGQVRVGRVLVLRVRQGGLRVRRREVGGLEVRGRRVAERRGRGVGGLVQGGQLREAARSRGGTAESVCALLDTTGTRTRSRTSEPETVRGLKICSKKYT